MPMVGSEIKRHTCLIGEKHDKNFIPSFPRHSFNSLNLVSVSITVFDELMRMNNQQSTNYPPYNIVKQSEDNFYIEVATAGFREGEVEIKLDNQLLTIKGRITREENQLNEYLHRGISSRDFDREFTLAEHVEVVNASQRDGILTVYLERKVPEEKKPKTIAINHTM
jgi:molecular chaperone IbpA